MEQAEPGLTLILWPPTPRSVHRARHELRAVMEVWELGGIVEEAALVLSELMTNAIHYGKAPGRRIGTNFMRLPHGLRIEVHDSSPAKPEARAAGAYDENGRGLALVDILTGQRWGVAPRPGPGKVVWAELTLAATA
jgi:anti-sigma regulatory factor (Ser/Thr protein kinase)